jgi:hypothetical protein
MIRTYIATIHVAASVIGGKDPTDTIRSYLEHLNGLGIHVDSIQLDPPEQEIPSTINQEDLIKLTENSIV